MDPPSWCEEAADSPSYVQGPALVPLAAVPSATLVVAWGETSPSRHAAANPSCAAADHQSSATVDLSGGQSSGRRVAPLGHEVLQAPSFLATAAAVRYVHHLAELPVAPWLSEPWLSALCPPTELP